MRKNILIAAMLLIAFAANAQILERRALTYYNGVIEKTIVRQYQSINILGYVGTSMGNYFFWTDTAMANLQNIELPQNYYVTDFEIYNDEDVYMCGYITGGYYSNYGFLGYFNINDVFFSTGQIHLAYGFSTNTSDTIFHFHELEVYEPKQNVIYVVAVGQTTWQGGIRSCVFNAYGPGGIPSGWSYSVGVSPEKSESITQITVTDDFVVTGGTIFDNRDAIKLRVFNKTSIPDIFTIPSASPNGYNDVYYFPSNNVSNTTAFPIDDTWQMTHIDGNNVAIASFWQPGHPLSTYYHGTLIHVYDINNMISTPNIAPTHTALDNYQQNIGVARIADLRYNKLNTTLYMVLKTDNSYSTLRSMIYEFGYPALYTPQFYYIPNYEIDHIDNLYNYANNIGIGSPRWSQKLSLYAYPTGQIPLCSIYSTWIYNQTNEFTSKMHTYKLDVYQNTITFTQPSFNMFDIPPTIECQRY